MQVARREAVRFNELEHRAPAGIGIDTPGWQYVEPADPRADRRAR